MGVVIVLPILLFVLTRSNYTSRYTIWIMPILFVIPAYMVSEVLTGWKKRFAFRSMMILIPLNIWLSLSFYNYQQNMIEHGDQFIPSITKLSRISDAIFSNSLPSSSIQINFSEKIKGELSKDLSVAKMEQYRAIQKFIDVEQKYIYPPDTSAPMTTSYSIHTIPELEQIPTHPVYIDNAIIITKD